MKKMERVVSSIRGMKNRLPYSHPYLGKRRTLEEEGGGDSKTKNDDDGGVFQTFISEIMFFTLIKI